MPAADVIEPPVRPALGAAADARLQRLEWTVVRRLDGLLLGDYRTLFRGQGLDLADLREYQHHDDVRHIDWNVTARLQVPHVREFTEDREMTAWFVLDLSGSVDFGTVRTKRELSAEFTAVLARLLTRHGNRVGALLFGAGLDAVLPARGGRAQVLQMMQRVHSHRAPASSAATRLGHLLDIAQPLLKRRANVFVVSDFISDGDWGDALGRLAQRHEVTAVRLYDPLEMALPDLGLVTMQDAETGEQLRVDTSDPGFRARFAAQAEAREDALRGQLGRAGVDTLELSTDGDLVEALLRFAQLRRQRLRASASLPSHLMPH